MRRATRPVLKVLHVPTDSPGAADSLIETAGALATEATVQRVMLDTADPTVPGGTGRRADEGAVAAVASRVPTVLAGGLTAANVADVLQRLPLAGVDVASGVERRPTQTRRNGANARPAKDPFLVGLFVKRAKAARIDRPQSPTRASRVDPGLVDADDRGRWGTERQFGGRYVPETLIAALVELEHAYGAVRHDPRFWADLRDLGTRYVGRPSPLYRADRLAAALSRQAGREPGSIRLYLKREDLNHTGAHKITNALGQALLTRRLGKTRVIAETGAGQHGVATATACALLDLPCVIYMGADDIRRQQPNVLRMHALGAEVVSVTSGSSTLKDAINEAMRDWVTNVATTHYVLGSAVGPHPYPTIVRDLQRVIGDEAAAQVRGEEGRLPDAVVACVGGGSNAIGLFARFIGEPEVRLVGVEAAGEGIASGRHAAALAGGTPGVLHGARSYLLQDRDGQVVEAHSISAGLDYPGIGPQLSALFAAGRMEVLASTDAEALDGLRLLTGTEGILPALEPSHAVAALPRLLAADAQQPLPDGSVVLLGLSGRGDKDLAALEA
jgi:tryptophan synthase beta subunit